MSAKIIPFPAPPSKPSALPKSKVSGAAATTELTPRLYPHVPFEVREFCTEGLGCSEVGMVQVLPPMPDADPRDYVANIARRVSEEGGRAVFGYLIKQTPLYLAAEFYAMHQTDDGLVDVTPKDEAIVCFAPDYDIPADLSFSDRSPTHRYRTYEAPTRQVQIDGWIAAADAEVLAHHRHCAAMNKLPLEDCLALKLPPDFLETSVQLFIECSEKLERYLLDVEYGRERSDEVRFELLMDRRMKLQSLVQDEFAVRQARKKKARSGARKK
jgi:hypothetical protein